jgi:ABC-type nitrate/sulfonate/bicarbonate transport system substrate-binding protein
MNGLKNIVGALGIAVPLALSIGGARAEDTLKVVIGQINNWENQAPTLGQDAGIFKKHGLVLENTGTQGAGETIQAVIAGSADIGGGVGAAGVERVTVLRADVGTHYSPEAVETFAGLWADGDLNWILNNFNDRVSKTLHGAYTLADLQRNIGVHCNERSHFHELISISSYCVGLKKRNPFNIILRSKSFIKSLSAQVQDFIPIPALAREVMREGHQRAADA